MEAENYHSAAILDFVLHLVVEIYKEWYLIPM